MSDEQKPVTAIELLDKGWKLTRESMALVGMSIPHFIYFDIDGRSQRRATRVAKLDELAQAIGAIDEDIERLLQGAPALNYSGSDVERLRQEKAALIELQRRVGRSGCPASTTVIEALFPDIPVRKKTASEAAEIEQWLAIRREAGLNIDPETAEVLHGYGQMMDPYGVLDELELPEECRQFQSEDFARSPGSDIWVSFDDLPDGVVEKIRAKRRSQKAPVPTGVEEDDPLERLGAFDVKKARDAYLREAFSTQFSARSRRLG